MSAAIPTTKMASVPPISSIVAGPPMWSISAPNGAEDSGASDQVIM